MVSLNSRIIFIKNWKRNNNRLWLFLILHRFSHSSAQVLVWVETEGKQPCSCSSQMSLVSASWLFFFLFSPAFPFLSHYISVSFLLFSAFFSRNLLSCHWAMCLRFDANHIQCSWFLFRGYIILNHWFQAKDGARFSQC